MKFTSFLLTFLLLSDALHSQGGIKLRSCGNSNEVLVDGACVCREGFQRIQKTCNPIKCASNSTLVGSSCVCNEGFRTDPSDGSCTPKSISFLSNPLALYAIATGTVATGAVVWYLLHRWQNDRKLWLYCLSQSDGNKQAALELMADLLASPANDD